MKFPNQHFCLEIKRVFPDGSFEIEWRLWEKLTAQEYLDHCDEEIK